jgi:hypothetical protein
MRQFFIALTRNPISLTGGAITTASGVLIVTLFSIELVGFHGTPYIGILSYLVLPAVFFGGLLLMPVGIIRERRRVRKAEASGAAGQAFPIIDLNVNRTRRIVLTFLVLTLANVVILSTATYKGVEIMESTTFCGTTCHTVMLPEHTAYSRSPHARVRCVECHIGPGANWFVKSKLSGAWQVVATTFELYPRPIPTPIHNLRPARDTCEQCHWPVKFVGDRLEVVTRYAEDESNTEMKTVLLLRIGGIRGGVSQGIHWHVDPDIQIRYLSDATRETIYDVEMTLSDGTTKLFKIENTPEGPVEAEWRVMDCVDCHNRPTHIYQSPEEAIDLAIHSGRIDQSLPYIRREGFRALQQDFESHDEARQGIASAINAFYAEDYPERVEADNESIERSVRVLGDIYSTNVFPEMKVTWGTYPDHIGHQDFPGCFRCHDDEHATAEGETISQDCFTCHSLLAMEEENPEVLELLQP